MPVTDEIKGLSAWELRFRLAVLHHFLQEAHRDDDERMWKLLAPYEDMVDAVETATIREREAQKPQPVTVAMGTASAGARNG